MAHPPTELALARSGSGSRPDRENETCSIHLLVYAMSVLGKAQSQCTRQETLAPCHVPWHGVLIIPHNGSPERCGGKLSSVETFPSSKKDSGSLCLRLVTSTLVRICSDHPVKRIHIHTQSKAYASLINRLRAVFVFCWDSMLQEKRHNACSFDSDQLLRQRVPGNQAK